MRGSRQGRKNPCLLNRRATGRQTFREHEQLRHLIIEACEPIAQFWPMKSFVHHNPIHGLEHLPFDQAVREAKHLLGGNGYLSNREYRQLFREGRITDESVRRAFRRIGPRLTRKLLSTLELVGLALPDVLRSSSLWIQLAGTSAVDLDVRCRGRDPAISSTIFRPNPGSASKSAPQRWARRGRMWKSRM